MGINIGVNDDIINGFYKLGFQSVVPVVSLIGAGLGWYSLPAIISL
jgi:hypothetical protein